MPFGSFGVLFISFVSRIGRRFAVFSNYLRFSCAFVDLVDRDVMTGPWKDPAPYCDRRCSTEPRDYRPGSRGNYCVQSATQVLRVWSSKDIQNTLRSRHLRRICDLAPFQANYTGVLSLTTYLRYSGFRRPQQFLKMLIPPLLSQPVFRR